MKKISLLFIIMAGLAFLLPVSCVREELSPKELTGRELILDISVDGMSTRAAGEPVADVPALMEDALDWIDIFVSGPFIQGNSQTQGVKKFHLTKEDNKISDTKWKLTDDWRDEDFVEGENYNMYISANSKRIDNAGDYDEGIKSLDLTNVTTLAGLQAALKDAVEYDYDPTETNWIPEEHGGEPEPQGYLGRKPFWGEHNDDKLNPEWLELHKKYISSPMVSGMTEAQVRQRRFYTNGKSFLMDGACSFTCGASQATSITLRRAAAKINMTVRFDKSFLNTLQKSPSGAPAWQFVNFAFSTPVFDTEHLGGSASLYDDHSIFTAGAIMMSLSGDTDLQYGSAPGQEDQTGYEFHFSTYSYPLEWADESGDAGVPGVIISVVYKQDPTNNNEEGVIQYYKIPVVDPALSQTGVKSIDRNKVYEVIATISSEGGDLLTDAYKVDCQFNIMAWGQTTNSQEVNNVDNRYYFTVTPTDIVLRGDDLQTAEIKIVKPEGTSIGMQYWEMGDATFEKPFNEKSSNTLNRRYPYNFVNDVAENAPAPYYFNHAGTRRWVFNGELSRGNVVYGNATYLQNKFTRSQKQDKLTLESYALPNKGIKYMKVRVYLVENPNLYQDITIRHYPTDFITSIQGAWASRKSAGAALTEGTKYYRPNTDENRGPEEYAMVTVYSHFREEYDTWTNSKTEHEGWDLSNLTEYNRGAYRDDFKIEHSVTTQNDYFSHYRDDTNYRRLEDPYTNTFYPDLISQAEAKDFLHEGEVNAYGPVGTDQYYYYGEGEATQVGDPINVRSKNASRNAPAATLSNFTFPNTAPTTFDYFTIGTPTSTGSGSRYWYADFTFYSYNSRKRVQYKKPTYYAKKFSHEGYGLNSELLADSNVSGNARLTIRKNNRWVNWSVDYNNANTRGNVRSNSRGYYEGATGATYDPFTAKVVKSSDSRIYRVGQTSASNNINYQGNGYNESNSHIYILRFSQSDSRYSIGKPALDENYLSKDNVVAPALMIASQLGSTYSLPSAGTYPASVNNYYEAHGAGNVREGGELLFWSARHCRTYLEVGNEGIMEESNAQRYYYDWRLPTVNEIRTILEYQGNNSEATIGGITITGDDRVLTPVLTAGQYRALDGTEVQASSLTTRSVRCVRELSWQVLELLEAL